MKASNDSDIVLNHEQTGSKISIGCMEARFSPEFSVVISIGVDSMKKDHKRPNVTYISITPHLKDDDGENIHKYFGSTCRLLNKYMTGHNHHILVHCLAGRSRSVALVAAYALYHNVVSTAEDAILFLRQRRPCSNPNVGFLEQLVTWSHQCQARKGPRLTLR